MHAKSILCCLCSSQPFEELRTVIDLCRSGDLHLAVAVVGLSPPPPVVVEGLPSESWAMELDRSRAATRDRCESLQSFLQGEGISADVHPVFTERARVAERIGLNARYADLAVAPASTMDDDDIRMRFVHGVLFDAGRPLLLAPQGTGRALTLAPKGVIVAWDGGLPATRAVAAAIPILKHAADVRIVCIDPESSEEGQGEAPGWDLGAYLARHGINVTVDVLASGGRGVDEVLSRHARETGSDMVVMGAYGHSRLRQRLFGGTTRGMIETTPVLLFMAH